MKYWLILCITIINLYAFDASSCEYSAEKLSSTSQNYKRIYDEFEMTKNRYDSEKDTYEGACSPSWGYAKDDESACGSYGYHKSSYDDAYAALEFKVRELEDAKRTLGSAYSDVEFDCDINNGLGNILLGMQQKEKKLKVALQKCQKSKDKVYNKLESLKEKTKKVNRKKRDKEPKNNI